MYGRAEELDGLFVKVELDHIWSYDFPVFQDEGGLLKTIWWPLISQMPGQLVGFELLT